LKQKPGQQVNTLVDTDRTSRTIDLALLCLFCAFVLALLLNPLYVSGNTVFPFVVIKSSLSHLGIVCCFLIVAIQWCRDRLQVHIGILHLLLLLHILLQLVALFAGENGTRSFWSTYERTQGVYNLIVWSVYACCLALVLHNERRWKLYLQCIVFSSALISLLALFQFYGLIEVSNFSTNDRLGFSVGNAAIFGHYISICLVMAVFFMAGQARVRKTGSPGRSWFGLFSYSIAILLLSSALLATESRGGVIAVVTSLITCGLIAVRRMPKINAVNLMIGLAGCILVVLVLLAGGDFLQDRLEETNLSHHSVEGRLQSWQIGLQVLVNRPLFGWGPENFIVPFGLLASPEQAWHESFDYVHNQIIEIAVGSGLAGLSGYVALLTYCCLLLIKKVRNPGQADTTQGPHASLPMLGGLAAYLVGSLFLFDSQPVNLLFFSVLGYCLYQGSKTATPITITETPMKVATIVISLVIFSLTTAIESKFYQSARTVKDIKTVGDWALVLDRAKSSSAGGMHAEEHLFQFTGRVWQRWTSLTPEQKEQTRRLLIEQGDELFADEKLSWRTVLTLGYAYLRAVVEFPEVYPRLLKVRNRLEHQAPNREDTHRFIAMYYIGKRDYGRARGTIRNYLALNPLAEGMAELLATIDAGTETESM
jgi:O-antigen ligase